jgi:antirestriction protein ArdC
MATGRRYRGINTLLLNLEAQARGFWDARWLTYRQAAPLGGHVRKAEHGATIVFFKWQEVVPEADTPPDAESRRVVPLLRSFTVFNAAQIDGLPEAVLVPPKDPTWEPVAVAEQLIDASGAEIGHGGDRAFYAPGEDRIQLPHFGQFASAEAYYGTALHELTHWTGHSSRCNRPLGARFGLDAYAFEELVAEMGAAFLCAHCRLPGELQHAAYIEDWLGAMKGDTRLVFVAAAKAQAAADFVLGAVESAPSPEAAAEEAA